MDADRPDRDKTDKAAATHTVHCGECMKELPSFAAVTREGSDYTMHFCGLNCFERWRRHHPVEAARLHPPGA